MICTISKHEAERKGYADALMLDWRGHVAEATGANVFFVKDGVIHTPTPDCFLDGITRQTVIELAKKRGLEVIERAIMPEELAGFEQCFLTGTAAEVTPVSEIGALPLHGRRDRQDADGRLFGRGDAQTEGDGRQRLRIAPAASAAGGLRGTQTVGWWLSRRRLAGATWVAAPRPWRQASGQSDFGGRRRCRAIVPRTGDATGRAGSRSSRTDCR